MTMPTPRRVTRRTFFQLAAVGGWSLGTLMLIPARPIAPAASSQPAAWNTALLEKTASLPRYRFDCTTPVPAFAPLGRLEEVWASPRYMTFTGCVVSYVGVGYFTLTAEESKIVDVVAQAGGDVADPEGTFLRVLTASTRVDASRLQEKLAEFGRPIIEGSLALAPDAPQAKLFAEWLASTA